MNDTLSEGINAAENAASNAGFSHEAMEAGEFTMELLQGIGESADGAVFAPAELLLYMVNSLFGAVKENSVLILSLAAICIMSAFLSGLAKQDGLLCKSSGKAGIAAATALPAGAVFAAAFGSAKAAMSSLEAIGLAVIPAVAIVGKGAGAYGFVACAQVMSVLLRYVFLPMVAVYGVISFASGIAGENLLTGVKGSIKKLFSWGLGLVMTVFSFCSVSSGLALNAANTLGARAAKYAGAMVPVVGGYLTEAADTVIASASLIKTAGGVCAAMTVVLVGLSPFVKLLAYYCTVNVLSTLAGVFSGGSAAGGTVKEILDITGELTGMTIGLMAMMAAFFIINIAVIAR